MFTDREEDGPSPPTNGAREARTLAGINRLLRREVEAHRETESELRERVKELRCLLELSRLIEGGSSIDELLAKAVVLLPPALQFPESAVARIRFRDKVFETGRLQDCEVVLIREMTGLGPDDVVEFGYLSKHSFLSEEEELLQMVAERLGRFIERLESQQALRLSECRYRLLADNTLDVIWSLDSEFKMTYINPAVTALTGYTPEECIGTELSDHFRESELERVRETIEEALSEGRRHQGVIREFNILDRHGQEVPVEIHAKVLFDEEGCPAGVQGSSRDIRDRRRTLKALRESEEKYRTLFETMAQGVIFQSASGEITAANPAAERILGLSLLEMDGRRSDDSRWRALKEDGSEFPTEEHPAMLALSGKREVRDVVMGIYNPKEDDYRWIKVSSAPQFRHGEENPYQVFSTFEDVTELRRVEAQRQAANLFSAELLESIRDGFFALDDELRVTYMNGCAETLMAKTREEIVGHNLFDVFPDSRGSAFEQNYRRALSERLKLDFETFYEPYQEWYEIHVYPSATGISVFFRRVTERKRIEQERQEMEAQLQQAQKLEALGRLAGGLAHDFNNMLSVILGHAEIALDSLDPDDPLREDLTEIVDAGQRSASLTRQLLAFARKQTISPKVLDLNTSIENALRMLKRLIGEDITLVWEPGSDIPPVKMDPSQLDQVLTNLVVNARDAIAGVGSIAIETGLVRVEEKLRGQHHGFQPRDYVKLAVRDTGCGIEPEVLTSLFDPFFTTKPEGRGTGLGLAMVHGVVQQNGGMVEVSSEIGEGSTFTVFLPALSVKVEVTTSATDPGHPYRGKETVLVVEDEPSLLRLTARMLQGLGYKVLTAHSPQEALTLFEEQAGELDLLLTDVVMPEMNGAQLSERLRAAHPGLKCLFMSGYTSDAIGERGGVLDDQVHFLQKPFTREELSRKAREALA